MVRVLSTRVRLVVVVIVAMAAAACGGGGDWQRGDTPEVTPTQVPAASTTAAPRPEPTQLKTAYINIMSPITLDANDPAGAETYENRLQLLIEQLQRLDADVIGLSEVSWTRANGSSIERLAKALRMEFQFVRANPWFPGQSKQESDKTVQQIGFEEGELLLSKYPILRAERHALNPRTSETEVRAVLHAVIRGPGALGEVDIYVARLAPAGDRQREAQAADLASYIHESHGSGPMLFLGDLAEAPDSAIAGALLALGLADTAATGTYPIQTCCRQTIVGVQPALSTRTDYILAGGLRTMEVHSFGSKPGTLPDGRSFYASDHNGIVVTFSITLPEG